MRALLFELRWCTCYGNWADKDANDDEERIDAAEECARLALGALADDPPCVHKDDFSAYLKKMAGRYATQHLPDIERYLAVCDVSVYVSCTIRVLR